MLSEMLSAFAEYKYLTAILVAVVIVTAAVWIKALGASRKRSARRDKLLEKLREDKELLQEFSPLTREKISQSEPERLLRGVSAVIQHELEASDELNAAFSAMPEAKRNIYALDFLLLEDADSLSGFFRQNGSPLTEQTDCAARDAVGGRFYEVVHRGYCMFDEGNEDYSVTETEVAALDSDFKAFTGDGRIELLETIKKYIYSQCDSFS